MAEIGLIASLTTLPNIIYLRRVQFHFVPQFTTCGLFTAGSSVRCDLWCYTVVSQRHYLVGWKEECLACLITAFIDTFATGLFSIDF